MSAGCFWFLISLINRSEVYIFGIHECLQFTVIPFGLAHKNGCRTLGCRTLSITKASLSSFAHRRIMRLFELKCGTTQFADVPVCVLGANLACETTPYGSHKSFWCKGLGLGSSSKQKPFAFVIFWYVTFDAKCD